MKKTATALAEQLAANRSIAGDWTWFKPMS